MSIKNENYYPILMNSSVNIKYVHINFRQYRNKFGIRQQQKMLKSCNQVVAKTARKTKHLKIDGLANIFRTKYPLASFSWLVVFLFSAAFTTYLIILSINLYYERQVTSTVRYLTEKQSVMPTITICNINPFTTKFAVDLLKKANLT